jgi:PAS domain S-box-containing protein
MSISQKGMVKKNVSISKVSPTATFDALHHLAFDNSVQPTIISSTARGGKIVTSNRAACKLLGYSKKELITKSRAAIFNIKDSNFKKMLKQRSTEGHTCNLITAIKKSGKTIPCEITSAVFMSEEGVEMSITTIRDLRQDIREQKNIDTEKEKVIAHNIVVAETKQKDIDSKKEKIVAHNIVVAKSKQKNIDKKKEKVVAENIELAESRSDATQLENVAWKQYVGKTSYDVMWDWDIATGEIYVGGSIEEVFGYKLKNNMVTFEEFKLRLLPEEKDAIEQKLIKTLASGEKKWQDSFMLQHYDDSVSPAKCRASIIRDRKGKAIRMIGALQNLRKIQELEKKLEAQIVIHDEDTQKFILTTRLSFDVIWEWNLLNSKIFMDEDFEKLFGYNLKKKKGSLPAWTDHIHPDDKDAVSKQLLQGIVSTESYWELAYRCVRANGSVADIFNRGSIIRNAEGKAVRMLGVLKDISRQKELEEKLALALANKSKLRTEHNKSLKFLFHSSSDVFYDSDLVTNEVIISEAYKKEFGYEITDKMTPAANWLSHIHADDKNAVMQDYLRMLTSEEIEWKYGYRFLKADNSIANVVSSSIVLRNADGKAYRMIGYMHDTSKQMVLEEKIEQEIKLKEKQIEDAMQEAKDAERSEIGKELHDNVNQLLGASKLYLDMAKRGDENSEMYLSRSSKYTMMAIEEIRKLTKGLTTDTIKNLGLSEAIIDLASDIMEVAPVKIACALESFIEKSVDEKFKLNVFRIVQEQMNNILKHSKATEVKIILSQRKKAILLSIADNGVGFDTSKKQKGIGIANIKNRAASFNATADFVSEPGQGCILNVQFQI